MNQFIEKIMGLFGKSSETSTDTTEPTVDYTTMKVVDLKNAAKEKGIKGYYKMRKSTLIETLNDYK